MGNELDESIETNEGEKQGCEALGLALESSSAGIFGFSNWLRFLSTNHGLLDYDLSQVQTPRVSLPHAISALSQWQSLGCPYQESPQGWPQKMPESVAQWVADWIATHS